MNAKNESLWIGLDVGSTTAKLVALDRFSGEVLFRRYTRHNARQCETAHALLEEVFLEFPAAEFRAAVCGSGGRTIADLIHACYIQEVVANSLAVKAFYPRARVAVELGGQDAKIVFFYHDQASDRLVASDMRMNGSCAGGTGAFIDEVAQLLKIPAEEFEAAAARGTHVYDISGRCGVFAKTDIQPLLNQGVLKEDIALSSFHAIAKQTIGGLAQGLELKPPIIFEGGPLTFNPTLIRVFAERLGLKEDDIIRPGNPETLVAHGTALSLGDIFADSGGELAADRALAALAAYREHIGSGASGTTRHYFPCGADRAAFEERHRLPPLPRPSAGEGGTVRAYLGIDAGSTTTKFVLLDEEENLVDVFYTNNSGEPLRVIRRALVGLNKKYKALGVKLDIIAAGTTGYGELLFAKALGADYHTVETVSHAAAALKYVPGASFILDIGGQDMKAITIHHDIVTGITLNEACSAGCGSFLENFAKSLGIPVQDIARAAFNAKNPAELGSRCTVFMNSCIITEQKNGKQPEDIMAGLCRSIIENVFTKVVRISNFSSLGDKIVVQGGTFKNDAVLRALEQYTGKTIIRAPYPGEMGAIGIALLTKKHVEENSPATGRMGEEGRAAGYASSFIGLDAMEGFDYRQESKYICPFCSNNCSRTLIRFSNGATYVTGNRCERGEVVGGAESAEVRERVRKITGRMQAVPDLMKLREGLLFQDYPVTPLSPAKDIRIGLPRVLEFWNRMPFWTTFWKALGFDTVISRKSNRALFERGLPFVASDTVCFPAKLVHGHIQDLIEKKADRIFMPMIIRMPSENTEPLSDYVCAVVKGYPLVIRYSDDPERRWDTPFDTPIFHWFTLKTRNRQICDYVRAAFGIPEQIVRSAIAQGEAAFARFHNELVGEAKRIIAQTEKEGGFAVVLAGRPYHNDELVNHDLSSYFTRLGIPVLTVDSLPGLNQTDLQSTRIEITNNFHARMLSGAICAARHPALEYVQIVSFGCGHDAILTDEVIRLMDVISGKAPLILKLDEGDAAGPLNIRIKSFIQTIQTRRGKKAAGFIRELEDPYPVKFTRRDWKNKILLIPNVSAAFCKIASAAIRRQGFRVEPLPLGGREAIKLGKKYVHNDICFPAQMNIGEGLSVLEGGRYNPDEVVIALAKYQCDCRLSHYASLARRALDEAGFSQVPIITTDKLDSKNMYPGFRLGMAFEIRMLWGLVMMDILEDLFRKIRPYEKNPGETNRVFEAAIDAIAAGFDSGGIRGAVQAYKKGVAAMRAIAYDRSSRKPLVFIIGEYLLNYHPGSNFYVEEYLEKNNMEVILPRMLDVFRRDYLRKISEIKDFHVSYPFGEVLATYIGEGLFDFAINKLEKTALKHPLYEPSTRLPEIAAATDRVMHRTFTSGEGWLIPGEILHHAARGVHSFVILQPFGCLPNHICGRGVVKRLKEEFPNIQILPLDYDPDTSFANIENRLQMLIMNARELEKLKSPPGRMGGERAARAKHTEALHA
ncbi:MAG: acyl-CoA dehydratase activase [Spirochaetia bacterium]|jgi:predicted CoA-substrate-specific enzyme activase|nr:acyl-CoA dehydratase activase [Spirochaetia bacterium]